MKNNKNSEWFKNASLKERIEYLITYYGMYVIVIGVLTAVLADSLITSVKYSKPCIFSCEVYSCVISEKEIANLERFVCERLNKDPKKTRVDITSELLITPYDSELYYSVRTRDISRIAAGDLDFLIGSDELLESFMDSERRENCFFVDIRDVIQNDLFERLDNDGRIKWYICAGQQIPYCVDVSNSPVAELFGFKDSENYYGVIREDNEAVKILLDHIYD